MKILDNKICRYFIAIGIVVLINILVFMGINIESELELKYTVLAEEVDTYQLFYSNDGEWKEENSISIDYNTPNTEQEFTYAIPKESKFLRIDLGNKVAKIKLSDLSLVYLGTKLDISEAVNNNCIQCIDINAINIQDESMNISTEGTDPFIAFSLNDIDTMSLYKRSNLKCYMLKGVACIIIDLILLVAYKKRRVLMILPSELYRNKSLIISLAKNDFKTKYAGSYLGIIWAFIQPIVTVLVYWFVFQMGFKSQPIQGFPFVLWLVAGMVPWFFFSEALVNATNSLLEYSYLVKKVVFKVSILPIIKIISSMFVHLFFIFFTICLFLIYGYKIDIYTLQVIYYTFCMFILVLGLSYCTCSIIIFFKDLGQIIAIVLQVGMWMTPIMWSYDMLPGQYQWILKLNPLYYIVEGYRDSLINKVWFWQRYNQTIYFWILVIFVLLVGAIIFKKLKVHFADVL